MTFQFSRKALYLCFLLSFFLGCLLTYYCVHSKTLLSNNRVLNSKNPTYCNYVINRVKGFEFILPVLSTEPVCESPTFTAFKTDLQAVADSLQRVGAVTNSSIYLREFEFGEWLAINPKERYHPASLMKVALLLTYLRQAEAVQGILTQKLLFTPPPNNQINPQYYTFPTIQAGKEYTIHELLYYMIANSDNNATWLLSSRLDNKHLKKMFFELGLPEPVEDKLKFTMSAEEISVFFKAIMNASYLSPEYSDYAARLLSNCAFQNGMAQGMPKETKMWHKFGEWRYAVQDYELHESGVVYIQDRPYLITIMTKGTDTDKLAGSIRVLTQTIHGHLIANEEIEQ